MVPNSTLQRQPAKMVIARRRKSMRKPLQQYISEVSCTGIP